mgnify:FL=1|tara:strand:+ start:6645 stop:7682 length:1038 start_codon:yes stop_codon:yes gene_type:complete
MDQEFFPLLTNGTYLNTAYVGPMSKALADFRREHEAAYVQNGGDYKTDAYVTLNDTHIALAEFFGASSSNTFVIPNFSIGIRNVISLLPKKLNILLLKEDYPSMIKSFEEEDFNIHKISLSSNIEEAIDKRLAHGDIDILALSIVQYASGLLVDMNFLKKIKQQYPNLILIADGTQFLGGHNFNFDSSPFDVLAASGYKWLLAGFGNGVLMVSDAYLDMIKKNSSTLFNLVFSGHFNILAVASLRFAIDAFTKNDFSTLMKKKDKISQEAKQLLDANGFIDPWVSQRENHSSIFILKGKKDLYKRLIKNKIKCVPRGKGVRISFHYFNTNHDLSRLIEVLKKGKI